jgi:DNA-binding NarL/FixJ family response regulator
MICGGAARKEIADTLEIAEATVRHHVETIFRKTGAKSALQLVSIILYSI